MAPTNAAQYEAHYLHLMSSVLATRKNASPFTLVLDSLQQIAASFLEEVVTRGLSRHLNVVHVTFESKLRHPAVTEIFAWDKDADELLPALESALADKKESLVIVDNLHELMMWSKISMTTIFELVVGKYASTLVGVYHTDEHHIGNPYAPQPLDTLKYMATTIITVHSLAQVIATKAARLRSLPEPTFGLLAGAEGVVQALNANSQGVVLRAEFRRRSGREETETYFLRRGTSDDYHHPISGAPVGTLRREFVTLLDSLDGFRSPGVLGTAEDATQEMESTFNLGLTDKQRAAREGVVLPYFDAQREGGGEGGRILYDMGEEDDFDEEEDEI